MRGHDLERAVKAVLEDDGWLVIRAAGSLGVCDLVALQDQTDEYDVRNATRYTAAMLIEVKGDRRSPWVHFGPAKQRALIAAEEQTGAEAWMAWCPKGIRSLEWIPRSKFPVELKAAA